MKRIHTNLRWKCKTCNAVTLESEMLFAESPFLSGDMLIACPACKHCEDGFWLLCDEPGCIREVTGGGPTGNKADEWGGYRQTCYVHSKAKD